MQRSNSQNDAIVTAVFMQVLVLFFGLYFSWKYCTKLLSQLKYFRIQSIWH